MLKLIYGRAGTGKSAEILHRACAGKAGRHILVVPETQSHETERRLCEAGGGRSGEDAEVLTFSRLANRIFQAAGGLAREELDAGGRLLLMYRAVQSVADRLKVYAKPSRRPAFLTGLLAAVDELKSCCVAPEQLAAAGEAIGGADGDRLTDLGLICSAYAALTEQIALDPRDRLTRAAEKLAQCGWADDALFYLDGFVDFTPQEMRIIRLLMEQGREITVALTCDRLEEGREDEDVFSSARRTAAQLIRMAGELGKEYRAEEFSRQTDARSQAMRAVEAHLFGNLPGEGKTIPVGDDVQLFCAPDARSEVEWTAAKILELVRTQGLRFRQIGVVARGYERYDALVESVFAQYGVPVFRSVMSGVMQKPVLTLVTAALDAVTGGYAYDDVFRYLKTDLTDIEQEERDELENYVLRWNVHGSRWTQEAPWTMNPRGYVALKDRDRAVLERLDALRRRVIGPLERLRRDRDRTGRGQAMALYRFLEEIGLDRRLEERTERLRAQGELGLAEEYRQLWQILCSALEQCARLVDQAPMGKNEFAKILQLVLSQYDVGTIPVSLDRVSAGEMTRQSGHGLKALFLLGADDASIPGGGESGGILTDDDREKLAGVGIELGQTGKERLRREMTAVYTACTCPDQKLIVTWPGRAGKEETKPCFAVERLKKIFPGLEEEKEGDGTFRLAAPGPALERAGAMETLRRMLEQMPQWSAQAQRIARAGRWERGRLSQQASELLYGRCVSMSPSRLDKYKLCHFAHFMSYGLEAQPRSTGFSGTDYGTFVHDVLQHVIASPEWRAADGGVDAGALERLTRAAVERYVREELGGTENKSARFLYLFRRMSADVEQIVRNVAEELAVSRFTPMAFELGFGNDKELPPIRQEHDGVEITLNGVADRVDGYEKDGKLYLRIVDYKTYIKPFDLTEVSSGIGLQMLIYLFALREQWQGKVVQGEIVPAGVLYLPACVARVKGSSSMPEEKRQAEADKTLRRCGLLLDDPEILDAMERPGEGGYRFLPLRGGGQNSQKISREQFERLETHVRRALQKVCSELAAGNIAADPFWRSVENNACQRCDYAAACHFEHGRRGDRRRWTATVSADQFWASLADEENGEEQGGDEHGGSV